MVGILLPPSVPGALVNFAAVLCGKVPVNLNYTAPGEILASCARQCEIETVVTSRAFLERVDIEVPAKTIFVEDLAARARFTEKIAALAMSWLFPSRLVERALGQSTPSRLDDLATVIFSSGSTGDPKGVMLSHFNLVSNIDQVSQTFMLRGRDRILGVLPFFHSFGFTVTLWLPAARGVGVIYHPNPLDLFARHSDFPAGLSPPLLTGRFRQRAVSHGRRGETARAAGPCFRGPLRNTPARRVRMHGMLAGGRGQHT